MTGRQPPDSVARSLSACALRSRDARSSPKMRLKDLPLTLSSTLMEHKGFSFQGASSSSPLLGRRRPSAPAIRPRTGPGVQERRPMTSSAPLALKEGGLRFPTLSASFSATWPSKAQLKQRKKAKQEVNEVMKFDEAFDMAYRRAVQRTAAERKMLGQLPIQVVNSGSPMCVRELLGLKKVSGASLFMRRRSKEDSLWGTQVLARIPGSKEEEEDSEKTLEGRRKSSIKQSFNSFGDVVVAAQQAARKELLDGSPRSAKGGESRRNSVRRASLAEETVARLLRRTAFNEADLGNEFELKEILDPPAPAQMYTRFKVEDISSFPASEQDSVSAQPAYSDRFCIASDMGTRRESGKLSIASRALEAPGMPQARGDAPRKQAPKNAGSVS
ncbi:macrod2 [Symbiodinium natans]|uniref:Macrod2 protein n=1 Tax=Symbiodinium natans TaxID=878477 RepID=A0A812GTR8_9DINO|nr:macrod2 [Symbiodinium natans]